MKKLLALLLVVVMVLSLVACGPKNRTVAGTKAVYATATFGQKFSPFFSTTAYDTDIVNLFTGYLLAADRGGAVIYNGIKGEKVTYNGTEYTYYGMGDVEVVQNDDGTVDYNLTMRDDIKFSDGTPATIDDVIFGIYVACDPTYDGSQTIYALPIEGMEDYRSGMDSLTNVILAAGPDAVSEYSNEEQTAYFWDALDRAGNRFCQSIADYCLANYADYGAVDFTTAVELWGYEADDTATMWAQMIENYGYDLSDEGINLEVADTSISDFLTEELGDRAGEFEKGVETGDSAPNIAGIKRTGDYTMTVHMTKFDATAIYNMAFGITPLHWYGDKAAYDYANNKFGFTKGDLSTVKAKTATPLGCGPYTFEGYSNGVVTLKANPNYFLGAPATETLLFQEATDSDYVPGIVTGTFDIAQPSISEATLKAIQDGNSNADLVGDTLTTYLVDYRGYGYLGINADLVNIDGDPGSEASKALRKGFMTLFAVYRDTVINSYYGDRASVIQYPISNTSWAAPQPADEGYRLAYSTDADGNDIYTDAMTDQQKYDAAKEAAITWFKAAGFTYDEASGKFTDVTETYEVMIPGAGQQDHPAYGVAVAASQVLEQLGITLQVNDVNTSTWNNALEGNTAMMWAAAWQSSVDPDMTQVYHSSNAHGNGTNSNHYSVDDADLDKLIVDGRSSADTEYRKSVYKSAMEIIMDWGCELPLYQRKDCTVTSSIRIDNNTMPKDMTPYWGWYAEIETLATK
jgi:peptide/nickel transport system substrate-binding protein